MIRFTRGNLLDSEAQALVNTVNEIGVMGKGIALMILESFPSSSKTYMAAASRGEIHVGNMFVTPTDELIGPRWIIHFPTKKHWRHPSRMEWIRDGLRDLARVIREKDLKSIALPPVGCGSGGLEWTRVRHEIELALKELRDVDIVVYEPSADYHNSPKKVEAVELTPARAMIAEIVRRYGVLGLGCTLIEVQKLAWFLKRNIDRLRLEDPLQLKFVADKYGPYSDKVRHLLKTLDGSYLHCEKRLADTRAFESIWFDSGKRAAVEKYLASEIDESYVQAVDRTAKLIDGFESPLGMELLGTVDWLLFAQKRIPTVESIRTGILEWPAGPSAAKRKSKLFDDRLIGLALRRLESEQASAL
jgi:O-acetyl-ADP-ribose deacetylase (regulator of RNase III)